MRLIPVLMLLPLLAACTQQQICINQATKDLRVVTGFVEEAEANIARGYAIERYTVIEWDRELCGTDPDGDPVYCRVPDEEYRTRPKAIDLDAERAKLRVLLEKQAELAHAAELAIAACKATYPE